MKKFTIPKKYLRFALPLAVIFVLAATITALVFLREKQGPAEETKGERPLHTLTEEEKKEILKSLSAPPGVKLYTDEEKRQILKSLSAPKGSGPSLSEEEKKAILESLSASQE